MDPAEWPLLLELEDFSGGMTLALRVWRRPETGAINLREWRTLAMKMITQGQENQGKQSNHRVCNLCGTEYAARSKFERFCQGCKEHSELYHFHEWLPAC